MAGALAVLVGVLLVPVVATLALWGHLLWFGVHAPFLPTLGAVTTTLVLYTIHIAVLSRAVRPLVRVPPNGG